jgi:hypothetical protein
MVTCKLSMHVSGCQIDHQEQLVVRCGGEMAGASCSTSQNCLFEFNSNSKRRISMNIITPLTKGMQTETNNVSVHVASTCCLVYDRKSVYHPTFFSIYHLTTSYGHSGFLGLASTIYLHLIGVPCSPNFLSE